MSAIMDKPLARRGWRSRPALLAGIGLAVAATVALGALAAAGGVRSVRVERARLTIEPAVQGVFHDFTPLQGKVVPRDTIYLDALEGGQVERILAQPGDLVVQGQPLIQFRNTQLELEVLDREGRLIESITQLQSYEKQLEQNRAANEAALATIDYNVLRLTRSAERRDALAAKGYLSAEQRDQTQDELQHNRKLRPLQAETNRRQEALRLRQLPQIASELAGLQQSLKITRAKLGDLTVRAPISGRLTAMDLKIGENRNRGERLAEIVPDTGFKIAADVDEFYLSRLRVGQIAEAEFGGRTHRLRVSRLYPKVKDGVFQVDMEFVGAAPAGLTPGETVQGKLSLGGDRPALILPAGAFLERSGGDYAFVLTADGRRAERRRIRIGRRNAEQLELIDGLRAGERVVTSDYEGFERMERIDFK
jgi:HlyD family secretion protein